MKNLINDLKNQGLIEKNEIGFDQIINNTNRAFKDLKVSKANLDIDSEAAFNYAYLAMLRIARALMFSHGYRPKGSQQHKTSAIFADAVLGSEFSVLVTRFDRMRKFRNKFTYDEPGILVSRKQTEEALKGAQEFVQKIAKIIQKNNPQEKLI